MKKNILILIPFFLIFLSSCSKNLKYIEDRVGEREGNGMTEFINSPTDYKLQPYDYLYITIRTTNEDVNNLFETISTSYDSRGAGANNAQNFFFTGYLVNDTGYVQVPILGDFKIEGHTINEVRTMIDKRTHEILKDAVVNVRLTSFRVTFMGEFGSTGTITFFQEKLTVLEAVAAAGGINDYGNKAKLLIVRKQGNKYKTYRIDLTKRNILEKKELYLHPNDLLYVEPVRSKIVRRNLSDYAVFVSALSTTVSAVSSIMFFITLNKQ